MLVFKWSPDGRWCLLRFRNHLISSSRGANNKDRGTHQASSDASLSGVGHVARPSIHHVNLQMPRDATATNYYGTHMTVNYCVDMNV